MRYIILSPAGHAYQRNQKNVNWICSSSKWNWATKFNNLQDAINEMEIVISFCDQKSGRKTGRDNYRIVEYGKFSNIFVENGVILDKSKSQLIPFNSFC